MAETVTGTGEASDWELRDELRRRRWFMESRGYRECTAAACNCNSWHGGFASERLSEIRDAIGPTSGVTLVDAVRALVVPPPAGKPGGEG